MTPDPFKDEFCKNVREGRNIASASITGGPGVKMKSSGRGIARGIHSAPPGSKAKAVASGGNEIISLNVTRQIYSARSIRPISSAKPNTFRPGTAPSPRKHVKRQQHQEHHQQPLTSNLVMEPNKLSHTPSLPVASGPQTAPQLRRPATASRSKESALPGSRNNDTGVGVGIGVNTTTADEYILASRPPTGKVRPSRVNGASRISSAHRGRVSDIPYVREQLGPENAMIAAAAEVTKEGIGNLMDHHILPTKGPDFTRHLFQESLMSAKSVHVLPHDQKFLQALADFGHDGKPFAHCVKYMRTTQRKPDSRPIVQIHQKPEFVRVKITKTPPPSRSEFYYQDPNLPEIPTSTLSPSPQYSLLSPSPTHYKNETESLHNPPASSLSMALKSTYNVADIDKKSFPISSGYLVSSSPAFLSFRDETHVHFSTLMYMIRKIEKFCREYEVQWAEVSCKELAAFLSKPLIERIKLPDIIQCLANRQEVEELINKPGHIFRCSGGLAYAGHRMIETWEAAKIRRAHLDLIRRIRAAELFVFYYRRKQKRKELDRIARENYQYYWNSALDLSYRLCETWNEYFKGQQRVVIHIPSTGFYSPFKDTLNMRRIQSEQVGRISDLVDPNVTIIYVSFPLEDDLENFTSDLIEKYFPNHDELVNSGRLNIVIPEACRFFDKNTSLAATLAISPEAIQQIFDLLGDLPAYIIPGVIGEQEVRLSAILGIPLFYPIDKITPLLSNKSAQRELLIDSEISIPPGYSGLQTRRQLLEAILAEMNLYVVTRFIIKIDGLPRQLGLAYWDCSAFLREYTTAELREEKLLERLMKEAIVVNKGLFSDVEAFLTSFDQRGGVIEGAPSVAYEEFQHSDEVDSSMMVGYPVRYPSAHVMMEPDGQFWMMGTTDSEQRKLWCTGVKPYFTAALIDFQFALSSTTSRPSHQIEVGSPGRILFDENAARRVPLKFLDKSPHTDMLHVKRAWGGTEDDQPVYQERFAIVSQHFHHFGVAGMSSRSFRNLCTDSKITFDDQWRVGSLISLLDESATEEFTLARFLTVEEEGICNFKAICRSLLPDLQRLRLRESLKGLPYRPPGEAELFDVVWWPTEESSSVMRPAPVTIRIQAAMNPELEAPLKKASFSQEASGSVNLNPLMNVGLVSPAMSLVSLHDIVAVLTVDEEQQLKNKLPPTVIEEIIEPVITLPDFKKIGVDEFDPTERINNRRLQRRRVEPPPVVRPDPASIALLNRLIPSTLLYRMYSDFGEPVDMRPVLPEHQVDPTRVPIGLHVDDYLDIMERRVEAQEARERLERERQQAELRRLKEEAERLQKEREEEQKKNALKEYIQRERILWAEQGKTMSDQVAAELEAAALRDLKEKEKLAREIKEEEQRLSRVADSRRKKRRPPALAAFMGNLRTTIGTINHQTEVEPITAKNVIDGQAIPKKKNLNLPKGQFSNIRSLTMRAIGETLLGLGEVPE
ncbi:hypothetical protein HDU76_002236 [Blyttiomyces sp. JEL0837]|nr:hypothetical protein HDU76_002236 [Blyttiomyces sp. JEL0837]